MADTTKRARGDAGDDRRHLRRDPRAEPDTVPPAPSEPPRGHGADKLARQDPTREKRPSGQAAPSSVTRAMAATRAERPLAADETQVASGQDSNAALGVAGAVGLAALRRQLATLQMHLADAQGQLAQEQQGRAEDADALAVILERVANSERAAEEAANLRAELEREREFVEELRVSVREKYEDCNTLRQRLADAESLAVAKGLEEATERHALADRAELFARQLDEAQKQLELARASDEAGRTQLAVLSTQLEDSRRERGSVEAELERVNVALKNANMKAFAANKQLESWKVESQRAMDQNRLEHQASMEALTREVAQSNAVAVALRRRLDAAKEKLEALTTSLGALDQKEREINGLRELAEGARRLALENADHARKALAELEERATPTDVTFATAATIVPASLAPASGGPKRPPGPPPRPAPLTKPIAAPASIPEAEKADTPSLEIGVTEMRMEDLVEELREAQSRKR